MRLITVLAAALLVAGAAQAAPAAENCAATDTGLPSPLTHWTHKSSASAAAAASGATNAPIPLDQALTVTLAPSAAVTFAPPPGRPAAPATFGGVLAFEVKTAGTYVAALGAGAWIDVVQDGKAITSTGHGHGPACSTIRKMVDFSLQPGVYLIQLSGAPAAEIGLLVARKP